MISRLDVPFRFSITCVAFTFVRITEFGFMKLYFHPQLQHHGLIRTKQSNHPFKIGTAERKSLIIFCYNVVLIVVALTGFTVTTRNGALFAAAIAEYWRCEIAGVSPQNSCDRQRESYQQLTYPGLSAASFLLIGIYPAVNLVFAVNVRETKKKFKTWRGQAAIFCPCKEQSTDSTATTMSSSHKKE